MPLTIGDPAPDFTLPDQDGKETTLSSLNGKKVVLFFYPKADTPGCTMEACAFSTAKADFDAQNTVLVGISPDNSADQLKFANKYGLTMPLMADANHEVAEKYGIWGEKTSYGKTYLGVDRTTFVIDESGNLAHIFQKVKPDGHAAEVLTFLQK